MEEHQGVRDSHEPAIRIHLDRQRAAAFGSVADRYDRARPSYPTALIDDLMAQLPSSVLDVGCGTGRAGLLLAARGCEVLGVEPDTRMAKVAEANGLSVEVFPFEMWDPMDRTFDLVVSAQAWHWLDPAVAPAKAGAILRGGGRLAAFWNSSSHSERVRSALDKAYQQHAPELANTTTALGAAATDGGEHLAAIRAAGYFTEPEEREYHWELEYPRDAWLELLQTHSDHVLLDTRQRERLLSAVGETIDALGGSLLVYYRTGLVVATRIDTAGN